ncbi:uncharacterized protein [Spinacia oleracea]|uniref:Large ribosomal subunit protein bL20c n=1 Tax=Spinacia oleracea TaxID=3562 RepID=A0A9R0JF09_SPIOL|nr:uncharacterized protein LOC110805364 [Spinacia oleracea]
MIRINPAGSTVRVRDLTALIIRISDVLQIALPLYSSFLPLTVFAGDYTVLGGAKTERNTTSLSAQSRNYHHLCCPRETKMNKKKVFQLAKGFRGRAKNCIRIARERVEKALQYSYRDRRTKKRDMRSLWIERINAGSRQHGVNYGNFMCGLMKENIQLNRKVLSELAMHEPYSFKALVDVSRNANPGNKIVEPKKVGLAAVL